MDFGVNPGLILQIKGPFMLNVKYRDGAFCPCSAFISSVFLYISIKLTDTDQMEQYHRKPWGGSVTVTTRYVALMRHEKEIKMVELFEVVQVG